METLQGDKDTFTFKYVLINQLFRVTAKMSNEWKGGYWETKVKQVGKAEVLEKVYIPDTRLEFENSVICLHDLLEPHFKDEMIKASEGIDKELADLKKESEDEKWDDNTFINKRLKIMRKLFRALSKELHRHNYFEEVVRRFSV